MHAVEGARGIDIQHLIPVLGRQLAHGSLGHIHAGAVHQQVKPAAKGFGSPVEQRLHAGAIAYIHGVGENAFGLGSDGVQLFLATAGDGHGCAFSGESKGDCLAHACAAAYHQCVLSG